MSYVRLQDIFVPLPKQLECYRQIGRKRRIFYGGARGGGKTACAVWCAMMCSIQFPGLRTGIFRRTKQDIEGQIITKEMRRYIKHQDELGFHYTPSRHVAEFDNGAIIFFRGLETAADIQQEQGIERDLLIIDEAPQHLWDTISAMFASNRTTNIHHALTGQKWRATAILTGNPGGVSQVEFKYHFVKVDTSRWTEGEVKMKDEFVFVASGPEDNSHLSEDYLADLESQPEWRRRQWLKGDWDVQGGTFFESWNSAVHIDKSTAPIDPSWPKWRSIDLGYKSHESVCLWFAQDPITADVVVYNEYGTTEVATDKFIENITRHSGRERYSVNWADPAMFINKQETEGQQSPATMFQSVVLPATGQRANITLTKADNSREPGWRNVMQWMYWEGDPATGAILRMPKLRIRECCKGLIETIPIQVFLDNKFDLDTKGRDDYVDALRYGLVHIPYGKRLRYDGTIDHSAEYIYSDPVMEGYGNKVVRIEQPVLQNAPTDVYKVTRRSSSTSVSKRYYEDSDGTIVSPYTMF